MKNIERDGGFSVSREALSGFVADRWGAHRDLELEVRPFRGGLESLGVADVTARFRDGLDRQKSFRFVVKDLVGTPAREVDIYEHVVAPLGGGIAPELLGVQRLGPERALLFLERVRPLRAWPWRDEDVAVRTLERLARLHAEEPPEKAVEALTDWNYERDLQEVAGKTVEALRRVPRDGNLAPLRRSLRPLERTVEALPEIRRELLAFNPFGRAAIHGDAHPGNALVRSGRRPVLLDWGRARLGSPLEDVSSWLQSLGYWEPRVRRRHDTLLARYLAASGLPAGLGRELRDAYWLAGASNALSGALYYHLLCGLEAEPGSSKESDALWAATDALRVIRRADSRWRGARLAAPPDALRRQTRTAGPSSPPTPAP